MPDVRSVPGATGAVAELVQALDDVVRAPWLPTVVVLYGETGRGKTYALQRFYDTLAASRPGCWRPGLALAWPPTSTHQVRRDRKRVAPSSELWDPEAEPRFYWVGVGAAPTEGAAQVDMSVVLAQQLHRQLSGLLSRARRRSEIAWAAARLAFDAVAELIPGVGTARTVAEHTRDIAALARGDSEDRLAEQRRVLHEAWAAVSKLRSPRLPLVVALDDAQSAEYETLYLASGLITSTVDGAGGRYLPTVLDSVTPGPLLYVCTAWEHRLSDAFDDPFQAWLRELERDELGLDVRRIRCADLTVDSARELLQDWDGAGRTADEQILRHIAQDTGINPLVLAECVGQLEDERSPLTGQLIVDEQVVARLPISPEQHIKDRLVRLDEEPGYGRLAHAVLSIAAHYSTTFPNRLLTALGTKIRTGGAGAVEVATLLLRQHGLISASTVDGYLVDSDVHGYLYRKPLPADDLAILHTCAVSLLHWCASDLFHDDLRREPLVPYESVRAMLAPAARLVREAGCDDPDALLIAAALVGGDVPTGDFTVPALGFVYAQDLRVRLDHEQILAAVRHFGASRLSVRIVRRRLLDDPAPVPADLREALIAALMEFADRLPAALVINSALAKVGDWERALNILRPLAPQHEPVALRLANQLTKLGQVDEAEAVLTARIDRSEQALLRLANLLADQSRQDEAIAVLRPFATTLGSAAALLANLLTKAGQVDEAVTVLRPLADHEPTACVALADLLADQGRRRAAIEVLHALGLGFGNAGFRLAGLYTEESRLDEAIEVLRPLVLWYRPGAAMRLANLYLTTGKPNDAIAVLSELAEEYIEVADRLAQLLVEQNRHAEAAEILRPHAPANRSEALELAKQLASRGRDERAINVLRPHARTWDQAAIRAGELLVRRDRTAEAIAVLRPLANSSEHACIKLAQLLTDASDTDEVIDELRDYTGFPTVAVFLANRLVAVDRTRTEEAMDLLRPTADRHEATAIALADLLLAAGRRDEAVNTLRPLADRYERVATRLADVHREAGQRAAAIAVLRPLADRYQQPAARLTDLLVEDDDVDGAIEVLRPLVGRFHEAGPEVARLMSGQRRTAEAIELLSPLAGRIPTAATTAAHLLAKDDRLDEAVALLRPLAAHPEIALALAGHLLRQRATKEAISLLQTTPGGLRDIRSRALLGGALLLAGDRVAGLNQLNQMHQMHGPVTHAYHAVCTVVADLGRDDVFGVLVNWRASGQAISEVAAGYLLRLLVSRPRPAPIGTTVRRIWNNDRACTVAVRALTAALQAWIDDPSAERPPLQIISYLEVLLTLGAGAGLRAATVAKLVTIAARSPATRESFARYAAVSRVAADLAGASAGGDTDGR